jgi:hypothetical protein
MRSRIPPYLALLLAACVGTEVGNPTFACGDSDGGSGLGGEGGIGSGGHGGSGGSDGRGTCRADGSDCGLAAYLDTFDGETCPGGNSRTALRLDNLTDAPLSGSVQVSDDAAVEVIPDRFELPPFGTTVLAVVFAPPTDAAAGRDGAVLHVVLDGGENKYIVLDVLAMVDPAAPPALGVLCGGDAPCELLDLGTVPVGEAAAVPLTVVNDGCADLSLLAPDPGAGAPLALVDPPAFPVPLPPRSTVELSVEFAPTAAGPLAGNLVLATEEGAVRVVPWEGRGE